MALPKKDPTISTISSMGGGMTINPAMRDTSPPPRAVFPGSEMASAKTGASVHMTSDGDALRFLDTFGPQIYKSNPQYIDTVAGKMSKFPNAYKKFLQQHKQYTGKDYVSKSRRK